MDAQKDRGIFPFGNLDTPVQRDERVRVAGQHGAQSGRPELWRKAAYDIQREVFFKKTFARARTGVVAAVARIQHHAGKGGAGFPDTSLRMSRAAGEAQDPAEAGE